MTGQFAPVSVPSLSDFSIVTDALGNITPQTLYFYIQFANRAGRNLLSPSVLVSILGRVRITLNSSCRATGEDLIYVAISVNTIDDPATAVQVAEWQSKIRDSDGFYTDSDESLPVTINLTEDDHVALSAVVADEFSFPTNLINGMLREVTSEAAIYRWDENAGSGDFTAGGGFWVENPRQTFLTQIDDTTDEFGCDRAIELAENILIIPPKPTNGDSLAIKLAYRNGLTEDAVAALEFGNILNLEWRVNGEATSADGLTNYSTLLAGLIKATPRGHYRISDRSIVTTDDTDTEYIWQFEPSPLTLKEDLLRGYMYLVDIVLSFNETDLQSRIPAGSSLLGVLFNQGLFGTLAPEGILTGAIIPPEPEGRFRVVPGLVLPGVGIFGNISIIGVPYRTPFRNEQIIPSSDLTTDTANQIVAISGTRGGNIRVIQSVGDILATESIRAFVSTESGISPLSSVSNSGTLSSAGTLEVTVTHPYNAVSGRGIIRADYPDFRIRTLEGTFNPPELIVYLTQDSSTIYQMPVESVVAGATQLISLTSLAGATIIGSVPSPSSDDFSAYKPSGISLVTAVGGSIPAGDYEAIVAYNYPSPNIYLTKINHDPVLGCVPELGVSFADLSESVQYWGVPVAIANAIRSIPLNQRLPGKTIREISQGKTLWYDSTSLDVDDGVTIFKPDDLLETESGRWKTDPINPLTIVDVQQIATDEVIPLIIALGSP